MEKSRWLIVLDQVNSAKEVKVIEGIVPLEIQAGNQIKVSNKRKKDLDGEDVDDNIEKVAIEGNLSPK